MKNPQSLHSNLIYLCGEFSHGFHAALTAAFRTNKVEVTAEQFSILAILFYHKTLNQKELGIMLNRDKTTIARVISNMEERKLVTRISDKRDARNKIVALTPKGRRIQKSAVEVSGSLYMKAMRRIPASDVKAGLKVISKLIRNINL